MHPLIGITGNPETNRYGQPLTALTDAYSRAVADAGGVPVLIPPVLEAAAIDDLYSRLDGVLLSGGGDVDPAAYGSDFRARLIDVHAGRDALELDLARRAVSHLKPLLGICRGCQVLNVALGGTLYPDLPSEPGSSIRHEQPGSERSVLIHQVLLEPGTRLGGIVAESEIGVNSHHHQGLRDIPPALSVGGRAPDGLVEAVELREHPFALAVQWHPEWLTHQRWTRDLFRSFVEAAASARAA